DPDLEKHSPALSLIYEVTRRSLAAGLDCDYMTGEQPYKMRLATASNPLYRLQATPEQLAVLPDVTAPDLRRLGQRVPFSGKVGGLQMLSPDSMFWYPYYRSEATDLSSFPQDRREACSRSKPCGVSSVPWLSC